MKKSIAAFAFLFLPFLAAAQPVKTPVSAADPYGVDFSKVSGNVVQITEYKGNDVDSLSVRSITTYEDRRPQTATQYNDDSSAGIVTKYTYNGSGLPASITGCDSNGYQRWRYEYKYNSSGQQTEEKSFSAANVTEGKTTTKYNENGSIREHRTYNSKDELMLKETLQYNERGFVSADITQYPDGKLLKRTIYTYTKGGHIAEETHYDAGGFYERVGYTYSENGQLTSFSSVGKDYKINSRTSVEYDILGRIWRQTITGKDKAVTTITYIYDSHGNWVWKSDGTSQSLRKIIYAQ